MTEFFNSKGRYRTRVDTLKTPACRLWENMKFRVEKEASCKNRETYRNVTCCKDWLDFQNFAEWYEYISTTKFFKLGWHLDKDVLCYKEPIKVYSPDTCVFLPKDINNMLVNRANYRGEYPVGVTKTGEGYNARVYRGNLPVLNFYSDNILECFLFYKKHKEQYVREFVNRYPSELDPRVYSFFNEVWEVTIND